MLPFNFGRLRLSGTERGVAARVSISPSSTDLAVPFGLCDHPTGTAQVRALFPPALPESAENYSSSYFFLVFLDFTSYMIENQKEKP